MSSLRFTGWPKPGKAAKGSRDRRTIARGSLPGLETAVKRVRSTQIWPWPTASTPPSLDPRVGGLGTRKRDSPETRTPGSSGLGDAVRRSSGTRSWIDGGEAERRSPISPSASLSLGSLKLSPPSPLKRVSLPFARSPLSHLSRSARMASCNAGCHCRLGPDHYLRVDAPPLSCSLSVVLLCPLASSCSAGVREERKGGRGKETEPGKKEKRRG